MSRSIPFTALATVGCLVGGVAAGFVLGSLVHGLPFHAPESTIVFLSTIPALAGVFGGGALWGIVLARIHGLPDRRRAAAAGSLGFGLAIFAAVLLLSVLERAFVEEGRLPGTLIHVVFTLLFVPATFLVASVGTAAILRAGGSPARWFRSALGPVSRLRLHSWSWTWHSMLWAGESEPQTPPNAPPCSRSRWSVLRPRR
ncbi:MAG: hypothetical protein WD906_06145 [Anaerolineales bacterium]